MSLAARPLPFPQSILLELPFNLRQQIVHRQFLQILRVEPFELGSIENTVRAADTFERKFLQQVGGTQKLFVAARGPADQGQKIAERLGQKSFSAVQVHVGRTMPLRETRLVGPQDQGYMRENGELRAQRSIQQHLLRRIRNVIGSADNMRDAHIDVIYDHAHLVHRLAKLFAVLAGTQQNEILDFIVGELAFSKDRVEKSRAAAGRNLEANGRLGLRRG